MMRGLSSLINSEMMIRLRVRHLSVYSQKKTLTIFLNMDIFQD